MNRPARICVRVMVCAGLLSALARDPASLRAQRGGMFLGSAEDPAIAYSTAPLNNAVSKVNERLRDGSVQLTFDGRNGYLRSALAALEIPIDSQALVFSQTSFSGSESARPTRAPSSTTIASRLAGSATLRSSRWLPRTKKKAWCSTRWSRNRSIGRSSGVSSHAWGVTWPATRSASPAC
jgi:hypothetical protein